MRRAVVISASTVLLALAGCGDDEDSVEAGEEPADDVPELVVFAASSLGPAFEEYAPQFGEADVKFSFAGSDDLAAQIRQGVIPDVYAAANTDLPDALAEEGLLEEPTVFITNELVLAVPADSEIDDIADIEAPDLDIAVGDPEVPVGAYTREVLDALGSGPSQAILDNVASSEPDVAGIVAKLTQGAVDAGFVYQSDVDSTEGELEAITLSADVSPDVAYGIGVTTEAKQPDLATEFVEGVVDGAGQEVLLEAGFEAPPAGG